MNFNSIIQTNSSTPVTQEKPSAMLGQKDFLRLLTAQMQTQDPFDPVDNKEMLAQMAQFSSLSGLSEINDTLKSIQTKLDGQGDTNTALIDTLNLINAKLGPAKPATTTTGTTTATGTPATTTPTT